jgi:arylsulfatase A-like enzyme
MVDLYDGAILYTDDNLGRLLKGLEDLGVAGSTVVAVTGDHGEALGEHGLHFTHDFTLYDEVLRVPLVIRGPSVAKGAVVDQQVRLMDLTPTLLDLAGVQRITTVDGVSLVPLLRGGTLLPFLDAYAENAPQRPQFPEQKRVYFPGNRGKWRMLRTERFKLIKIPHPDGDLFELYDLSEDPGETRNRFEELAGDTARLLPLLDALLAADQKANELSETGTTEEGLDPAAREQLRTLGYIP